jgi:hypothetical protein
MLQAAKFLVRTKAQRHDDGSFNPRGALPSYDHQIYAAAKK